MLILLWEQGAREEGGTSQSWPGVHTGFRAGLALLVAKERLTQHDGIHSSPRAELNHDLQETKQSSDQGPRPGTYPSARSLPTVPTPTGVSDTQRGCTGAFIFPEKKNQVATKPKASAARPNAPHVPPAT